MWGDSKHFVEASASRGTHGVLPDRVGVLGGNRSLVVVETDKVVMTAGI